MMILSDHIHIQCLKCNHKITIDQFCYEPTISYFNHGSNGMGEEINYSIEDDIKCEVCGNTISFSICGSEYPIGAFNFADHNINGAKFINNPQFIIQYSHEEYIEYSNDDERLRSFLRVNQIDTLYHFTRIENLASILNFGLLPRKVLETKKISSIFNDPFRYDNCTNATCLSIEFPNYKMFYSLRMAEPNTKWVVLKLNIDILFEYKCAYCWANAGDASMYNKPLQSRMGTDAFIDLYSNHNGYPKREETKINDWFPTNPQAEVLVFDVIPLKYIDSINFQDCTTLNNFKHLIPDSIIAKVYPKVFSYRSDWEFWQKETY